MPAKRKVVVIGGGIMGSAAACFSAMAAPEALDIVVVERDPTYSRAFSALSAAGIRQQFSTPANIALSLFGAEFPSDLRRSACRRRRAARGGIREEGYLLLATTAGESVMRENHAIQKAHGAHAALLSPEDMPERFPWLSTDGLALGSLGLSGEGWFDAYGLLQGFRRKARSLGVAYATAEAAGIAAAGDRVAGVMLADGSMLPADVVILAAGAWSAPLAATAGVDLPVRARRRSVFAFHCRDKVAPCPLVVDPSGVWFRPEGEGRFIGGVSPADDPDGAPLEVQHAEWDEIVWPALAARAPAFESVKVVGSWAATTSTTRSTRTGSSVPTTGCGTSSSSRASAATESSRRRSGRAAAEWIVDGGWRAIDVGPLGWERIRDQRPLVERNVI